MSHRDWKNLRSKIDRLRSHQRQYTAVTWCALGGAISAALAALAWYPTYLNLPKEDRLGFAWIGPAMLGLLVLGVVVAGLMFWVARLNKRDLTVAVDDLLGEMDEMPLVHGSLDA